MRSWLAPLYADLHSPPGCMISVNARLWPAFLSALNAKAVLALPVHSIFMPLGSRVLEYQQTPIRSPSDLPRAVPSHKTAWVRIADPSAEHTRLSKASKANLGWLQCFQADLACPLQSKPLLARKAAADACAEGTKVGIGGWFISSRSVSWFAETWTSKKSSSNGRASPRRPNTISLASNLGPACTHAGRMDNQGPGSARPMHAFQHRQHGIRSRSEQAVYQRWPLQIFVQLVAAWACKHKWSVLASHIPGEHNVWADQLSRGNTSAFDSKPHARCRFRPHDFWPHKWALSLHPADAPCHRALVREAPTNDPLFSFFLPLLMREKVNALSAFEAHIVHRAVVAHTHRSTYHRRSAK